MNAQIRSSTDAALRQSFEDDRSIETRAARSSELISTVDRAETQLRRFAKRFFREIFLEDTEEELRRTAGTGRSHCSIPFVHERRHFCLSELCGCLLNGFLFFVKSIFD